MSAPLLYRAASQLNAAADAATPGPWTGRRSKANTGVNWVVDGDESKPADHAWVALMMFGDDLESDAEYIALVHPPFGREIASYLTLRASQWETRGEPEDAAALVRIARQVLREPTP